MVNRIGNTCVLCNLLVSEVDLAVVCNCNVLKKSISLDCVVDVRLVLLGEVDNLSIAAALEIEDAVVIPTVLVVTDEESLRICGKCCLTCTGKTEEDCCVLTFHVCVSRAVH